MTNYKATLLYAAPNENAAAQKLTTALYLGDVDVDALTIQEVNADGSLFDYPITRKLLLELDGRQVFEHRTGSVDLNGEGNAAE